MLKTMLLGSAACFAAQTETGSADAGDVPEALHRPETEQTKAAAKAATEQANQVKSPSKPKATNTASAPAEPKAAKPAKKATASAKKPAKVKAEKKATIPEDARRTVVPNEFKARYAATNDTCGDRIGLALKAATTVKNKEGRLTLDISALKAIAKANDVDFSKYEKLNNGMKRMNVANKLRGLVKGGETVTIGGHTFTQKTGLFKSPAKVAAQEQAAA